MLAVSMVVARLLLEPGTTAPVTDDDAILMVQRKGVTMGGCPGDAGPGMDAAVDAAVPDDAAPPDAGVPDAPPACETIEGDAISMVVRPRFSVGPSGARFALLFVTPNRPIVENVFDPFPQLSDLSQPLFETKVIEIPDPALGKRCSLGSGAAAAAATAIPGRASRRRRFREMPAPATGRSSSRPSVRTPSCGSSRPMSPR